ncbi:MAG: DUF485 domain-containing protein [Actinobacteria bacterium]|nr:MAG: DUF485 domain-containing protein [Actinomycetota bacterium]
MDVEETIDRMPDASAPAYVRHGEHIDTIDTVDRVFEAQRRLSFTYGAIFFLVTLAIPAGSVWWKDWYATPIWGGFTMNYLFVSLLYYVFLWAMAWTYSKKADALDERLMHLADEVEAQLGAEVDSVDTETLVKEEV